ncbi:MULTISPECIES: putative bifunctional diguanylate cyclase/phosphodiesterase [Paenibacillus]|uniref:putative bifunctional diguanylate cyclase/phosphodiesterase n=1 Tax=Paenibacillus TaxID=44249 RepID=UPI0022B8AAEA|nr:EAL domain-containing protein [Paenibacillus caseinilyticus]MCZ8523639.1 EAL domain-containing protein [Paenibacillus caseinilyticus]
MAHNKSPAGEWQRTNRTWRDRLFQHASLIRLWFTLSGAELIMLAVGQLLGESNDWLDVSKSTVVILLTAPVLYYTIRKFHVKVSSICAAVLLLLLSAEVLETVVRYGLEGVLSWEESAVDLLLTLILVGPLTLWIASDVRYRDYTERQLTYLAYNDMLTGLPNRQMFQQSLTKSIGSAKLEERKLVVMFIDLDRFKNVNDTFGHAFGDQLLVEAAERLKGGLGAKDVVSRQGGDEFTVLVEEAADPEDAEQVAHRIIQLLSQPFLIEGHELRVGCSIGIAMYPQDGEDSITLMKNADTAMYRAKDYGKNGYQFYKAEMNDTVIQKLVMEEWLNKAIEHNEFVLYYQPQVDIFTGKMNGMEALIRWNHPRLGFISPGEFIALAEETGQIIQIGEWVLREACRQNKAWQDEGFAPLKMAVNISPVQFHQHNFIQIVLDALQESGLDAQYLELEITEGIAMYHVDQVIEKLRTLRELGLHISMDDFGTGYSSLSYLKKFPITKLKIAQQFVRDIPEDPDDAAIVQAIMAMALSLKLNVIAEGVETDAQLSFLLDIKCQEIQGYIFSRPIPAADFTELLKRNSG